MLQPLWARSVTWRLTEAAYNPTNAATVLLGNSVVVQGMHSCDGRGRTEVPRPHRGAESGLVALAESAEIQDLSHESPAATPDFETQASGRVRMRPVLDIRRLRVTRGDTVILREINWRVARGENWVILGANGSGKTSLLKALTGFLTPTAGEFSVLGRSYGATDWRALRLHIGVVTSAFAAAIPPAEVTLDTVISGKFAQLDLWARVTAAERAAARHWLRVVGAERVAEREWLYLSQGERQRVLIARALMAKPRLLIFDEPCAGLDPVARQSFLELVDRLGRQPMLGRNRSGKRRARGARPAPALVLVTHHVEEITPAFTHALLLRRGEVVAAGPREAVLTSRNLSAAFGASLRLATRAGRLALAFR